MQPGVPSAAAVLRVRSRSAVDAVQVARIEESGPGRLRVENGAAADESPLAEFGRGVANDFEGAGHGEGDLDREDAAVDESADDVYELPTIAGSDDGDDAARRPGSSAPTECG